MKYFDYGIEDFIPCDCCGPEHRAVDIHHLNGRGKDKDVIENLIALCRDCHVFAHSSKEFNNKLKDMWKKCIDTNQFPHHSEFHSR